jgi:hypothetical protein
MDRVSRSVGATASDQPVRGSAHELEPGLRGLAGVFDRQPTTRSGQHPNCQAGRPTYSRRKRPPTRRCTGTCPAQLATVDQRCNRAVACADTGFDRWQSMSFADVLRTFCGLARTHIGHHDLCRQTVRRFRIPPAEQWPAIGLVAGRLNPHRSGVGQEWCITRACSGCWRIL